MSKLRILYVASEINPFLQTSEVADFVRMLPQGMQERGMEIRIFVPRFGLINERKNRLHEVVRLSGINIAVGEEEKPLVIKVASIPNAKLQVYFIDNDDYFHRKSALVDDKNHFHSDNDERAIFFCRGVLETVRKLGWKPDIIHCHGWMTSFIPLYVRHFFNDDPHFEDAKLVYSVYDEKPEALDKDLAKKLTMEGFNKDLLKGLAKPTTDDLNKFAMGLSDAVVKGSAKLNKTMETAFKGIEKPVLAYATDEERVA